MKESTVHRPIFEFLKGQPGLLISLAYLVLSLQGIFFTWSLYYRFGVNYLEFTEISDFLMVVLREPITLVMAFSAVLVSYSLGKVSQYEQSFFERHPPRNFLTRAYHRTSLWSFRHIVLLEVLAFLIYSFSFVSLYGKWKSERLRDGEGRQVIVQLADQPVELHRTLLGDSGRYLFLLDFATNQIEILPHENIVKLKLEIQTRGELAGIRTEQNTETGAKNSEHKGS